MRGVTCIFEQIVFPDDGVLLGLLHRAVQSWFVGCLWVCCYEPTTQSGHCHALIYHHFPMCLAGAGFSCFGLAVYISHSRISSLSESVPWMHQLFFPPFKDDIGTQSSTTRSDCHGCRQFVVGCFYVMFTRVVGNDGFLILHQTNNCGFETTGATAYCSGSWPCVGHRAHVGTCIGICLFFMLYVAGRRLLTCECFFQGLFSSIAQSNDNTDPTDHPAPQEPGDAIVEAPDAPC